MHRALFGFLALVVLAGTAAAQDLRVVFVNSEVIMQEYQAVQSVVETFNRDVQGWNEEAQRRKNELEELQRAVESQGLMLSEERRQEKELDYQRRAGEYEQFVQSIWGPDGLVEQRNEELLRPIISKIQALLAKLAVEREYDFIFDAADNNLLYADPEYDITQEIIAMLNSEESRD